MEITEVQVKLIGNGDERLKASCTLVVDGEFVIRDVKVIEGTNGLFVAMPSRKLTDHCPKCGGKNHLRAAYCNNCGGKLNENRWSQKAANAQQLHAEIAHPINSECRQRLHERVITAYESARAGQDDDAAEQASPGGHGGNNHFRVNEGPGGPSSSDRTHDHVAASAAQREVRGEDFGTGLV